MMGIYNYLRYKNRDKAIVLTYHGILPEIPRKKVSFEYRNFVSASEFERQIQFLLSHYKPLTINDFINSEPTIDNGFLITFDDGYRNNFFYALPILKKYGLQACFFVTTGYIETQEFLWTDLIDRLIFKTRQKSVELDFNGKYVFELDGNHNREQASIRIRRYLKRIHPNRAQRLIENVKKQLSDVDPSMDDEEKERYLFMNWNEIRNLSDAGQIIGSHTHNHFILSTLSKDESYLELRISQNLIEEKTEKPCIALSYPNGGLEDFTELQIEQLKDLNFTCAFTQIPFFNDRYTNPFQLRRINMSLDLNLLHFETLISGLRAYI